MTKRTHKLADKEKKGIYAHTYCGKIARRHLVTKYWKKVDCQHCLRKR